MASCLEHRSRPLSWLPTILLAVLILRITVQAAQTPPSFDGGLNLNVAASIARGGPYGFVYDSFFAFPAATDGPYILPAALIFRLAGITIWSCQLVNLVYLLGFAAVLQTLLRAMGARWYLAPLGVLCAMGVPGFFEYSTGGFGEIPALTWFLLGLLCIARSLDPSARPAPWCAAAGAAFALAYLTKVVSLVCIAPAALVILPCCASLPHRFRLLALAATGFLLPVLAWEAFRLIELGSVHGYLQWWHLQLGQVAAQSGAQTSTSQLPVLMHKGIEHFGILAKITGLPRPVLAVFLAIPFAGFATSLAGRTRPPAPRFLLASLSAAATAYLGWWLFITPTSMTWLRRIIDGLILQQCVATGLLFQILPAQFPNTRPPAGAPGQASRIAVFAIVLPAVMSVLTRGEALWPAPKPPSHLIDELRVAQAMRDLPADAVIFGNGWWQSPVLALLSGRHVMNYEHWLPQRINQARHKYLVTDFEMQTLARQAIDVMLAASEYRVIIQSKGASLYQLDDVTPYPAFLPTDRLAARLRDRIDPSDGASEPQRGYYTWDAGWAWIRPDNAALLARRDQTMLSIDLRVPADLLADGDPEPARLVVTAEDCLHQVVPIGGAGALSLRFSLICPAWPEARPLEVAMHFNRHLALPHQLDADNRLLGLLVHSIRLEMPSPPGMP